MGKPAGKKKTQPEELNSKPKKSAASKSNPFDEDTAVFITMSQEFRDEGNKLLQKRDHEGAMFKFEKALKLLPETHIDVAGVRTAMASCFMQMGFAEYPRAVNECNLALEVAPKYSKALLRRAKCFEALDRLDLAWKDVCFVLNMEPSNQAALEIRDNVGKAMEEKGIKIDEIDDGLGSEYEARVSSAPSLSKPVKDRKLVKEKSKYKKKKNKKAMEDKGIKIDEIEKGIGSECEVRVSSAPSLSKPVKDKKLSKEKSKYKKNNKKKASIAEGIDKDDKPKKPKEDEEKRSKPEDKEVVKEETVVARTVKLVLGDDIRWAQLPTNCSVLLMREIVRDRFPNLRGVLVKFRDQEGDFITITTNDELRKAEASGGSEGSLRLYITEVSPDQEPMYTGNGDEKGCVKSEKKIQQNSSTCIDVWILQFAQLFKNHVGFDSDAYLDLHEVGMRLYSEAIEDTVSTEEAQELFDIASEKFQEMGALALFNWGNVHMSKARKRVFVSEDHSNELFVFEQIKAAYDWSQKEYSKAGMRYQEALKMKPDFYEGFLALGQQQFERAKLCWSFSVRNKTELEESSSSEVLQLFNKAEESMEAGMQLWEEMEERRLNGLSKEEKYRSQLHKVGLDGLFGEMSTDEASEQAKIMTAQIYIVWGSLLYERSTVEFKLGLPTWEECLEVAVEKFELAGASETDIAVMVKNHCAHQTAQEGFGFRIDEIVQAWHEMYDAKRLLLGVPSFRLEPLFRRRVPRIQYILEQHI